MVKKFLIALLSFCICFLSLLSSAAYSEQLIPFGLCPKYNPRIMYRLYQPFIDYLSENTPYRFEIKLSRVYQDTIERLGRKEINIASCGPVSYIRARERYPVKPILRALSKDGKLNYQGIIIVRRDSPVKRLEDLKGKSFAFGQEWSTAGHILPEYYLMKANIRLKDLKQYSFLRHHDSVVHAVLKGQYDAGAVKDVVAYQHQKEGLRFIYVTDPIPTVPIIVRGDTPGDLVKSVKDALLRINPGDPVFQKRMAEWDEEFKYGFTEAKDSDYDGIRKILRQLPKDLDGKGRIRG